MSYLIDQSGKIEQTERHSVIACVNDQNITIFKEFPYLTFSTIISLLIFKGKVTKKITIDREYFGHEDLIKTYISQHLRFLGVNKIPLLVFGHVGKLSKAHQVAYQTAVRKNKPTLITNAKEILRLVFGIKKTG